jgi:hypothetical protein
MAFWSNKIWVPRDDQMGAVGKRSTQGFKGLSAHQEVVSSGQVFKTLQVCGQLPDELVVFADNLVCCFCYKKYDFHVCGFDS